MIFVASTIAMPLASLSGFFGVQLFLLPPNFL